MIGRKKPILDDDNPLFQQARPVLLEIFCRGVLAASRKQLVIGALLNILLSPFMWPIAIVGRLLHLIIVTAVWWILRDDLAAMGISANLVLGLGWFAALYPVIYDELSDLLVHLAILLTGGGLLRWLCAGYLSPSAVWRPSQFKTPTVESLVATMQAVIPAQFRNEYDRIMNLYLDSNSAMSEKKLLRLLDEYRSNSEVESPG